MARTGTAVELGLLGSVELLVDGAALEVGPPRRRAVLAALAVDAGRVVPAGVLIERVWGLDAPAGAHSGLYAYLTRLREVFAQAGHAAAAPRRVSSHGGFRLGLDADRVDLHRFRQLVRSAGAERGSDADRAALLDQALGLWRGPALAGLPGEWAEQIRQQLAQERLDAALLWASAQLLGGRPDTVVDRMRQLTEEHPLVEPAAALLVEALGRQGRTAEALECYRATRRRLIDELGIEPGPELRGLQQALLTGELAPGATRLAGAAPQPGPAQLPLAVPDFVGRQAELATLDALLDRSTDPATPMVISAIAGTAGIGKTALGLHWAHRNAGRFPDGQLYVNLRGFDPDGRIVEPAQAIRGFLDALGVPPAHTQADPDAQAALYRSRLAGKRMLIMLDNARDTAQVRPLLPGVPGCQVLITSRNNLTGLVASAGARHLAVGSLDPTEAGAFLAARIGAERAAAEPEAVTEIVTACAGLPLALALVAAQAAVRPDASLAGLADQLRDVRARLGILAGDDPHTDPRAVFSWSYAALPADAARLFRLLGQHPGPDIGIPAAASLTGQPVDQVRPLLAALAEVNLVAEHAPGRYVSHDLLRAYATELAERVESAAERVATDQRVLAHYLRGAFHASRQLEPIQRLVATEAPPAGVVPEQPDGMAAALAWFDTEHRVLLTVLDRATQAGWDESVWQLAAALDVFLERRGHWHDWTAVGSAGVAAADRVADLATRARAHRHLAYAHIYGRRYDQAYRELCLDVELCRRAGHLVGEACAEMALADLRDHQERHGEALEHAERAHILFRKIGDARGEGRSLNGIGFLRAKMGDLDSAAATCEQALEVAVQADDPDGQARAWDSLGYVRRRQGRYPDAITCYQRALALMRELADGHGEACVLDRLGDSYQAAGDWEAANAAWQESQRVYGEKHPGEADRVRAKLAATVPS